MATNTSRRTARFFYGGALLSMVVAGLVSSSDLTWRGIASWGLWILALLLIGVGGLIWARGR